MRFLGILLLSMMLSSCFAPPRHVTEPDGVTILRDLTYATLPEELSGEKLQFDLFLPEHANKPLPIVIWIHGGGWVGGDRWPCPIAKLATRGYGVAAISYRLSQGRADHTFPAALHDAKAAVRYLRKNAWRFGLDGERIGVWGASAGGHIAALLGTVQNNPELEGTIGVTGVSSRVQAVCALFPATDLVHLEEAHDDHWKINLVAAALLHGKPSEKPELAHAASPIEHVSATSAPFCFIHGKADSVIPYTQSERMHAALIAAGGSSTLTLIDDMPHGNRTLARSDVRDAAHVFLDKYLQPEAPLTAER
jgi:acetyl esterase/lipase